MGGLARFNDRPVVVIGHEKGNDTRSRIARNFGMARPEGYRKAIRLMDLADRFGLPVVTLVDTPGAYPGKGAEERGQAEAIARSTEKCLQVGVPVVSVIIGEGGSGGAVAFATADRIAMLEHSIYSVISPEGCASILWKDAEKMKEAAEALRLTAQDLLALGVIDRIVPEPRGGAQRDKPEAIARVGTAIARAPRRARRQEARPSSARRGGRSSSTWARSRSSPDPRPSTGPARANSNRRNCPVIDTDGPIQRVLRRRDRRPAGDLAETLQCRILAVDKIRPRPWSAPLGMDTSGGLN